MLGHALHQKKSQLDELNNFSTILTRTWGNGKDYGWRQRHNGQISQREWKTNERNEFEKKKTIYK